jgi:hypothetical protein
MWLKFSNVYQHCRPNLTKNFQIYDSIVVLYKFRHHRYTSQASPDDGLSGSKQVSSGIIRFILCCGNLSIFIWRLPYKASACTVPLTDARVRDIPTRFTAQLHSFCVQWFRWRLCCFISTLEEWSQTIWFLSGCSCEVEVWHQNDMGGLSTHTLLWSAEGACVITNSLLAPGKTTSLVTITLNFHSPYGWKVKLLLCLIN